MPIDVSVVPVLSEPPTAATAGWWMQRLASKMTDSNRVKRLTILDAWNRGDPPLPPGAKGSEPAYIEFQRFARSTFAALVVEAPRQRMQPIGIRTSADGDATGDKMAWQVWRKAGLPLTSSEVHRTFLRLGECPVIVGPPGRSGVPVITAEDPFQMFVECDPVDGSEIAALKVYRDDIAGYDFAYLYRVGRLDVAYREIKATGSSRRTSVMTAFSAATFDLDETLSRDLPDPDLMPVILFQNIDGLGEFEPHLDLLGRINHMILQRLVIAVMQAFKQRAATGLPSHDESGRKIRWSDVFAPDAGAFWALPAGVVLQELAEVDLRQILQAVSDDLKHLSAVTSTPMHMLDPSGENQSAEGAALSREGLVFKVEDRIARATAGWDRVMHTAFVWLGDQARADLLGIDVIWAPPERASLAERSSSAAQAHAGGVPWETIMTDIMQFPPDQVNRMRSQRDDDLLFAQQLAAVKAPVPSPLQPADDTSPNAPTPGASGATSQPEPANA